MINLGNELTEGVKIERYRAAIQADLREMCRTSTTGERWQNITELMHFATLKWPTVETLLSKRRSVTQPVKGVTGKRKSSGSSPGRSSKARVSVVLTDEHRQHNMKHRLCHICGKPDHIAANCSEATSTQNKSKGKDKGKQKAQDF